MEVNSVVVALLVIPLIYSVVEGLPELLSADVCRPCMEVHSGKALASVSLMALYRALFRQRETQV